LPFCPFPSVFSFFTQRIAFADEASAGGANGLDGVGKNSVFRGNPSQGHTGFDLLDVPGTLLGASSAGGTKPDLLTFDIRQTESGLPDDLAHAEVLTLFHGQTVSHNPHWKHLLKASPPLSLMTSMISL
jgi:hypothetical protein